MPPAVVRERCVRVAALARELAAALEGVADVTAAGARLAAIESEPFGVGEPDDDAADLCIGHGLRRDERGVCVGCGRADRPRAA